MRIIAVGLALIMGIFAWVKCSCHPIDAGINVPENLEAWDNMHKQDEDRKNQEAEQKVNDGTASPQDYDRYFDSCV